jgi:hypothetical protein
MPLQTPDHAKGRRTGRSAARTHLEVAKLSHATGGLATTCAGKRSGHPTRSGNCRMLS